jgi:HSP20 family protein
MILKKIKEKIMTLLKTYEAKDFVPRSFADIVGPLFKENLANTESVKFLPAADVLETEKDYQIVVLIPGMKKEDIKIGFREGWLTIEGERKFEKDEKVKKYHFIETRYGSFKRNFYLPDNINHEGIEAKYEDGILKVIVPKDEKKILQSHIVVK